MAARQVRLGNYIAYGSNDFLGAGAMSIIGLWVAFFYTTYCGLTVAQAGLIVVAARLLDAFFSPLIGYVSDHFHHTRLGRKFGRRRFFILLAIPLLPLLAAILAGLCGRLLGRVGAHLVCIAGVAASFLLSALVLKAAGMDMSRFLDVITSARAVASYRLSFGASLIAAGVNMVFGFAIAWTLAVSPAIVPIPGTRQRGRLEDNAAAADVTLTADELAKIDAIAPRGVAAGERYTEPGMRTVNL